jgi:hypothetical protein
MPNSSQRPNWDIHVLLRPELALKSVQARRKFARRWRRRGGMNPIEDMQREIDALRLQLNDQGQRLDDVEYGLRQMRGAMEYEQYEVGQLRDGLRDQQRRHGPKGWKG